MGRNFSVPWISTKRKPPTFLTFFFLGGGEVPYLLNSLWNFIPFVCQAYPLLQFEYLFHCFYFHYGQIHGMHFTITGEPAQWHHPLASHSCLSTITATSRSLQLIMFKWNNGVCHLRSGLLHLAKCPQGLPCGGLLALEFHSISCDAHTGHVFFVHSPAHGHSCSVPL